LDWLNMHRGSCTLGVMRLAAVYLFDMGSHNSMAKTNLNLEIIDRSTRLVVYCCMDK
jgi:hypothetical protein